MFERLSESEMRRKIEEIDEEIESQANSFLQLSEQIDFFQPMAIERANRNISFVEEEIGYYIENLESRRVQRTDSLNEVEVEVRDAANLEVYENGRDGIREEIYGKFQDLMKKYRFGTVGPMFFFTKRAAEIARSYLAYEIVKDRPHFGENPFNPLMQLLVIGTIPDQFRIIDGEEGFIVHFNINAGYENIYEPTYAGCYAQGDGEIKYLHNLSGGCKDLIPVKPPARIVE